MPQSAGRYLSLSTFLLVFICFLLPFARITCGGEEVLTLNGYELAFGATKSISSGWNSRTEKSPMVISAILCLLVALTGAALSLAGDRGSVIMRLVAAGLGLLLLLFIQIEAKSRLLGRAADAGAALAVKAGTGWILAALLFSAGAVVNILLLTRRPGLPVTAVCPPASGFCSQCGQPLSAEDRFCPGCGAQRE